MPKRKGGRKKKGGKASPLANPGNVHNPKNFGSDETLVTGCAGCVDGNVQIGSLCNLGSQAAAQTSANRGINRLMAGIVGQVGKISNKPYINPMHGGGNTGETTFGDLKQAASSGMGYGRVPITSVQECGVQSSTSMGAGKKGVVQSGGGDNTNNCVSACNNLGTPGYGLNVPPANALNTLLKGSGYPVVVPYNTNKCVGGGKRKRKTKRKRRKHKKRKTKRKHKKRRRHTRKRRGGEGLTLKQKLMQFTQEHLGSLAFPPQMSGGKKTRKGGTCRKTDAGCLGGGKRKTRKGGKRRKKRGGGVTSSLGTRDRCDAGVTNCTDIDGYNIKGGRKKMRGGYHQYGSNNPMTPGYASPKPGPLPWATGPLSKARQINCQDNYNHFTGKSSPSPVLDQAAPVTPFGGSGR